MKIKLAKSEVIHFIGIGGIGMSGLALVMSRMGFKVQGSDINQNKYSTGLQNALKEDNKTVQKYAIQFKNLESKQAAVIVPA